MAQIEFTENRQYDTSSDTSEYVTSETTNGNPDTTTDNNIKPKPKSTNKYVGIGIGVLVIYVIVLILTYMVCDMKTASIIGIPAFIICVVFFFMLLKNTPFYAISATCEIIGEIIGGFMEAVAGS